MHAVLAAAALLAATPAAAPAKQFTPAGECALADAHVLALPPGAARYALFLSLHDVPPEDRQLYAQVSGGVLNSLSDAPVLVPPRLVPGSDGTLLYFDLTLTGISPEALDRLATLGSGAAPFPEPFFLQLVKEVGYSEYGHWDYANGQKTWVTTDRRPDPEKDRLAAVPGPWANPALASLQEHVGRAGVIFEARWFWFNALTEPRYHELIGAGESIDSFKRLARVNVKDAEEAAAQVRGAVLDSEVGERARVLERTPTPVRFGRGAFHQSFDFQSSVNAKDVLKDVLISKADANESIATRRNGLQAYFVNDGKGKRLDKADPDVAQDSRTRLKDHQVWTGFHCMGCHEPERGLIPVADEVRAQATPDLELVSRRFAEGDRSRGQQILEKYFTIDVNELLQQDQVFFESAVAAATALPDYPAAQGLGCPKYGAALQRGIWEYVDRKVTLPELAAEVGYPEVVVRGVIERNPGLDHSLVGMLRRPQRRDQVEAGMAPLQILLAAVPVQQAAQP